MITFDDALKIVNCAGAQCADRLSVLRRIHSPIAGTLEHTLALLNNSAAIVQIANAIADTNRERDVYFTPVYQAAKVALAIRYACHFLKITCDDEMIARVIDSLSKEKS